MKMYVDNNVYLSTTFMFTTNFTPLHPPSKNYFYDSAYESSDEKYTLLTDFSNSKSISNNI